MTSKIQAFDFSVNLLQALLWQHDKAANLQSIIQQKQAWYDENQTAFWGNWITDVFDLRTANSFGLSVWSIILELPLIVSIAPAPMGQLPFGFEAFNKNFTFGNFKPQAQGIQTLTPDQARIALRLRYFQLQSRGTIPEINRFMKYLFKETGAVWVVDGSTPMTIKYVFAFVPSSQLQFVLEQYDILPRPAGVGVSYVIAPPEPWGFDAPHPNFDHGNFAGRT